MTALSSALLPILLIGYIALAIAFVVVAWHSPPPAKWLGFAAIAAAAPVFLWLGAFTEQFNTGKCYSSAVAMIANAVEHKDSPVDLAKRIRDLPMRGYETNCSEVEAAAKSLPNAKAP